jgi:membrane protein DedA with SNARE-associated domain/membrane-associated phospholipid phosphatase
MVICPIQHLTRMDTIQPYLDYFSANPGWALTIIFLIAFGEALLIIGLFVPSTVALVSAGMLVGTGHLDFWAVFWATAIGAILGDQVSYWAGRLYGERLKTMWPLNRYPVLVAKGEDFVRLHGGKSIAIGRFVPGVKAVVPGIVGMLGMSQPYFVFVNFTSGLVWAAAHVFPGILLGQGLALAGDLSGHLLIVLLALLLVVGVASWLIRLLAATLHPYTSAVLRRVSLWARSRNSRAMHRLGKSIQPGNPRATALVLLLICGVLSLVFLIDIVSGFMLRDAASNLDLSVATLMGELRNAPADAFMIPLTMLAERPVVWAMGLAMVVWLALWRGWRVGLLILGIMGFAEFASINLNMLVASPAMLSHGGFTSTPTLMAGLVFGFMAVLASHSMGRWTKSVVAAVCGGVVVAIAFSRVYLGAEWLSGILAGGLLALVLTSLFGMVIEAIPARRIRPLGLLGVAVLVFVGMGAFHISTSLPGAESRYAARPAVQSFTSTQWVDGAWSQIPNRRVDLAGAPEEVFAAQWVGGLQQLQSSLEVQGWKPLPVWRWQDAFSYLDAKAPLDKLPPRPILHQGLKAKLTMVLETPAQPNRRLVLRAFKAHVKIDVDGQSEPVFLLSVTPESPKSRFSLYAIPATQKATEEDTKLATAALSQIPDTRVIAQTQDPQKTARVLLAKP